MSYAFTFAAILSIVLAFRYRSPARAERRRVAMAKRMERDARKATGR